MNTEQVRELVREEYARRYPEWRSIRVTEVVADTFGGSIAVVRSETENGESNEEMCFAYPDRTVRIFVSTEELARFLELRAKAPLLERVFTRPIISGVVLLVLLVFVFALGFVNERPFSAQALSIIGSVLGLAAGYFFGSVPGRS